MDMNRLIVRGVLALLLLALASPICFGGDVSVSKQQISIDRHKFDPKNPPSDMPPLKPNEAAVCHFEVGCRVAVTGLTEPQGDEVKVTIEKVAVTIDMRVDVWVPFNATRKIIDHEEGHREICEIYYRDFDAAAEEIAERYVGREYTGRDFNDAIDRVTTEINHRILAATQRRCATAQVVYDRVNDHGRNDVGVRDAIGKAIAEESRAYEASSR